MAIQEKQITSLEVSVNKPLPSLNELAGEPLDGHFKTIDFSRWPEDVLNCPDCFPENNRVVKKYEGSRGSEIWLLPLNETVDQLTQHTYAAAMDQYHSHNTSDDTSLESRHAQLIRYHNKLALALKLSFTDKLDLRMKEAQEQLPPEMWCLFTLLNDYEEMLKHL